MMSRKLRYKMQQQYKVGEQQRRMLIHQLYELIDDLENRPVVRYHSFPYGVLERSIHKMLDFIERKWLRKRWAKMHSRSRR